MYEITLQVLSIENINTKIWQDGRKVCYLDIWMGLFGYIFQKKNAYSLQTPFQLSYY